MTAMSRRRFVSALTAGVAAPRRLLAQAGLKVRTTSTRAAGSRALNFAHTHTGQRLAVEYFSGGTYLPDALTTVNHFLRDFRTEEVHVIDPGLLDLLHRLADVTATAKPFQVISGYRSPATNAMLR